MPKRKAAHYLKQAEECRAQAARALRDADRESWLKLAGKWQHLAEAGEKHVAQLAQQPRATEDKLRTSFQVLSSYNCICSQPR